MRGDRTDANGDRNGGVSGAWLLNLLAIALIAVLGFWGREQSRDIRDLSLIISAHSTDIAALQQIVRINTERFLRIETKLDHLIEMQR